MGVVEEEIGRRYGLALFLLAKEKGKIEEIEKDLEQITNLFKTHLLLRNILMHPQVKKENKQDILEEIVSENKDLLGFLRLLIEKRRIGYLEDILGEYKRAKQEFYKVSQAHLFSPSPLSSWEREEVSRLLERLLGRKVKVKERIEEELLGGLRIECEGRVYDWTVKKRLEKIGEVLRWR